jgi:Rrf2 family transcriptional regulator, cysteine metabolism repressor
MTLLSRKVDYAILILSYLHQRVEGGSAREIAARFELSRAFVANILKLLCHKGFVASHRGVKGGYALQHAAEDIKLADLMDALDEGFHLAPCTKSGTDEVCSVAHICSIRGGIASVHQRIREVLRTVTLAELVRPVAPVDGTQFGLEVTTPRRPEPLGV